MVNYGNSFLKYPFNPWIVVSLTDSHKFHFSGVIIGSYNGPILLAPHKFSS